MDSIEAWAWPAIPAKEESPSNFFSLKSIKIFAVIG
jgi:hypothetical protein